MRKSGFLSLGWSYLAGTGGTVMYRWEAEVTPWISMADLRLASIWSHTEKKSSKLDSKLKIMHCSLQKMI